MHKPNPARRRLIKALAGIGAAAVAVRELPESWTRPLLSHILLPAHAQTSVTGVYATRAGGGGLSLTDAGHSPLDLLIAPAYALAPDSATAYIYTNIVNGVASVQVLVQVNKHTNGFYFTRSGIEVGSAGAAALTLQNEGSCTADNATATIRIDNVTDTANGVVTFYSVSTANRQQVFNLAAGGSPILNPGACAPNP